MLSDKDCAAQVGLRYGPREVTPSILLSAVLVMYRGLTVCVTREMISRVITYKPLVLQVTLGPVSLIKDVVI